MSYFNYRWDKCRVLAIGGTYVFLIEGGTNVGGTNVGGTNVGGRKVAASSLGRWSCYVFDPKEIETIFLHKFEILVSIAIL